VLTKLIEEIIEKFKDVFNIEPINKMVEELIEGK